MLVTLAKRDAGLVLGEGGDDGSSQSLANQKLAKQDPRYKA